MRCNFPYATARLPCTMTIYHWINVGMMRTKNIDLLEKVSRAPRMPGRHGQENKHKLGFSIEARPKYIEDRAEFRHWEIDTVLGIKGEDDAVLMTLAARKTRFECIIKVDRKDTSSISKAVQSLAARTGTDMRALFKTITSDNGSEFSTLEMNLKETTQVYFSHPYAAYERGTSENQHKLIQRLIPKSQPISTVSAQDTLRVQKWMNTYPRKQLNYRTSQDALMAEIKQIVYKSVKSPHRGEEMPFIHSQSLHTGDWINGKLKLEIRVKYIKPIVHKHLPFVDSFL
ncbi:IS30 family transposase [Salinicoccus albus]|uniref:IS30 family transposase n=1 Tax=Salinicoccus albus TaxID=418756 RepID=UPI0014613DF5